MKHTGSNILSLFDLKIHRMGIISTFVVWVFFILVPLAIRIAFQLNVDVLLTIKAAAPIMLIYSLASSFLLPAGSRNTSLAGETKRTGWPWRNTSSRLSS